MGKSLQVFINVRSSICSMLSWTAWEYRFRKGDRTQGALKCSLGKLNEQVSDGACSKVANIQEPGDRPIFKVCESM